MQKEQLERLILKTEKENEKKKTVRSIKTYILFVALYSVLYYWLLGNDILKVAILALVTAAIQWYINVIIYSHIFQSNREEAAYLESLKKKYYDEYGGYM